MNERFNYVGDDGEWGQCTMFEEYRLIQKHSIVWGDYINARVVALLPMSLGMLFEIGVFLSHALSVNLWNRYIPPYVHISSGYSNNLKDIKKVLSEWKAAPDGYYEKEKRIAFFEKLVVRYIVIDPIQNKIRHLRELIKSRPLLAREQLELEILQNILDAKTEAEIDTLLSKLAKTPTDAELRKRLISQAEAQRGFIIEGEITLD